MTVPGSFPGFLAKIIGLEVCREIADPKINPLASIEIIASASVIILVEDIFDIKLLKSSGSCKSARTSRKTIPWLGKSL